MTDNRTGPGAGDPLAGADPRVAEFLAAWKAARHGRLVPFRRDFDPMRVPGLLSHVWLYRLEPESGDFVCRLAGEDVNAAWGASIRGRTLAEIVGPEQHPKVLERWLQLLSMPWAQYGAAVDTVTPANTRRVERLVLPLASDSGVVDQTLGLSLYRFSSPDPVRSALVPRGIVVIPCAEL